MWQRIQTVYMVLGALMLFTVGLGNPNVLETVLGGFGLGLFLANCTYYKNRKRQFVLNRLAMLVAFALEAVYLYPVLESGDSGVLGDSSSFKRRGFCVTGQPRHSARRKPG